MAPKHLLVKRHGKMEEFDDRKVYGSVYAAALNAHFPEQEAEKEAERVLRAVKKRLKSRDEVSSEHIRGWVLQEIQEEDVAYLYEHHLDIN